MINLTNIKSVNVEGNRIELIISWGYEQTNVDFYQITEIKGKQLILQEIGGEMVKQTSHDSGRIKPEINSFKGEPMKKNIQFSVYNGNVNYYVKMDGARGQLSIYTNGEEGSYCSWGY